MTTTEHADCVIIGGGIMGTSMAFHMAELGYDTTLLERKQLSCGTTWHAAGLLTRSRPTPALIKLARYSLELYVRLSEQTGQDIGLKLNGSLAVTHCPERLEEFHRTAALVGMHGIDFTPVPKAEITNYYPGINDEDLIGGIFVPGDGQCNPADLNQAIAKAAKKSGATLREGITVERVQIEQGRVVGVETDQGVIQTPIVVNCAGMWGRTLAAKNGIDFPLHACEHYYIVTEPIADLARDLPVLREPDNCAYYKEDAGKLLLGAFERNGRIWGCDGIPQDFCFDELPGDFDHFMPVLEGAMHRLPVLQETGIKTFFCGPESFSADGNYYLGPASDIEGYYLSGGFNSIGIQSAGGAAMALSRWIHEGEAPFDLLMIDSRRIFHFQATAPFIQARAPESLGDLYDMHWPYKQPKTARNLRRSPLHHVLAEHNACFGVTAGWERPNWFAHTGIAPEYQHSYGKSNWFDCAAIEHKAVREQCAVFDLSSFGKFRLVGPDALDLLQYLSAGDLDVAPGQLVYNHWLNQHGGIEADLTITRLDKDDFLIITGPLNAGRDQAWLRKHTPQDAQCHLIDVTAADAVIAVMGPDSANVLSSLSETDFSHDAFPFATSQQIDIGAAPARAQRISYVGEQGWELFVPAEWSEYVLRLLLATNAVTLAGMHTLDACRIEKGFRHYGHDLSNEETLIEAGLGFLAALDRPDSRFGAFIGKQALIDARKQPPTKRIVQFLMESPDVMLYHNEPILLDGTVVGYLTSGAYGHHLGAAVGMGYVTHPDGVNKTLVESGRWTIRIGLEDYPAKASLRGFHDPTSRRMKPPSS